MTLEYSNNSKNNSWLKDYNYDYPVLIEDKKFKTVEHYLQYRIHYYSNRKNFDEVFHVLNRIENQSYSEFIKILNNTLKKKVKINYDILYQDYLFARTQKILQYPNLLQKLLETNEEVQEVINCNTTQISSDKQEEFRNSLMHIKCNSTKGPKEDPWNVIKTILRKGRINAD